MRRTLPLAALLATLAVAGVAYADLTVTVHVSGDTEGVMVRVTDQSGAAHHCTTDAHGDCTVENVVPGSVFVETELGADRRGSTVLIPEDGKVSIIVPSPSANPPAPRTAPPTE